MHKHIWHIIIFDQKSIVLVLIEKLQLPNVTIHVLVVAGLEIVFHFLVLQFQHFLDRRFGVILTNALVRLVGINVEIIEVKMELFVVIGEQWFYQRVHLVQFFQFFIFDIFDQFVDIHICDLMDRGIAQGVFHALRFRKSLAFLIVIKNFVRIIKANFFGSRQLVFLI